MDHLSIDSHFWSLVDKDEGCWVWKGNRFISGKGSFWDRRQGKARLAHRVAWELAKGPIPDGLCVCHHCDNPPCVRPDHLFIGTQKDNMQDASRKGRHVSRLHPGIMPRGERHWKAKLTRHDVLRIYAKALSGDYSEQYIANSFGVSRSSVQAIKNGWNWRWLTGAEIVGR